MAEMDKAHERAMRGITEESLAAGVRLGGIDETTSQVAARKVMGRAAEPGAIEASDARIAEAEQFVAGLFGSPLNVSLKPGS